MSARYLIRLDDACNAMDRRKWAMLERVLDEHEVRPIVAVVPDNQDPALMYSDYDPDFWEQVRSWARKGWNVAMHGYRHSMHPTDAALLVPYYSRSEFAGLSLEEQTQKIRSAWQLFLKEGITPEIWVAPAHSFDILTLRAILAETSIRMVSDGIAWSAYRDYGFFWVPQQLWRLAERRWGLWTVCLHPNEMSEDAIAEFGKAIGARFRGRIGSLRDVQFRNTRKSFPERIYHSYFWWRWRSVAARVSR